MKKVFCILSILTIVSPVFADPVYPETTDPGATTNSPSVAASNPGYALKGAHANDSNVASAGYVKGAYNATIKAVNTLNSIKQDTLSSGNGGNVSESGTGPVVTGISASSGSVTVTKGQVTLPVGSSTSSTQATIWIQ